MDRGDGSNLYHGLLCEEELLISPTMYSSYSLPPYYTGCEDNNKTNNSEVPFYATKDERDRAFAICLEKEGVYVLGDGYEDYLHKFDLLGLRFSAIHWIIKTQGRLRLSLASAFDAVNYLDRFISLNRSKKWKLWMVELLSIACLSIAAKSSDISVPPFFEIQMEDLEHSFEPKTIQRMELTVMKALDWLLNCVTAYSYVDLLTWNASSLHLTLTSRMAELLLSTLSDPTFMEFRPCVLAMSALRHSLEELLPSKANAHLLDVMTLLPPIFTVEIERCHKVIEERLVDMSYTLLPCGPPFSPSSPVTAVPAERIEIFDCCIDYTLFFDSSDILTKKRKMQEVEDDLTPKRRYIQHLSRSYEA